MLCLCVSREAAMVHSVDTTALAASGMVPASGGVLQSQLNRYEIQLADWCACPSGKTPAGKEKIADLEAKVAATRAQLQQSDAVRSQEKIAQTAATSNAPGAQGQTAGGRLLDVFA
jgi:hypothetical protein